MRPFRDALLPLVIGFLASGTALFALVWVLGRAANLDAHLWGVIVASVLLVGGLVDLAPRVRCPSWRRQTPKDLVGRRLPPSLGALVWSLDTGLVVTTYRASAVSWAALTLSAAGAVPWWAGLCYSMAFTASLATAILLPVGQPSPAAMAGPQATNIQVPGDLSARVARLLTYAAPVRHTIAIAMILSGLAWYFTS